MHETAAAIAISQLHVSGFQPSCQVQSIILSDSGIHSVIQIVSGLDGWINGLCLTETFFGLSDMHVLSVGLYACMYVCLLWKHAYTCIRSA